MKEIAEPYRSIRVFDARGAQLSPTTELRAQELVRKGRAILIADESSDLAIRLLNVRAEQDSQPPTTTPKAAKRRRRLIAVLRERDGDACFYCLRLMQREEMTLEHLLARHHEGNDSKANLVLAHKHCNESVGHLAVIEKIKIRERNLTNRQGDSHQNGQDI